MKGRRTGIVLNPSRDIHKDSDGFDDIDEFWDSTSNPPRNSSILSSKTSELYYDTSSVISEDESMVTSVSEDAGHRTPELSPLPEDEEVVPPPSTKASKATPRVLPVNSPDDASPGFPMDDNYDFDDDQPFAADESPLPAKSPSVRISLPADHGKRSAKGKGSSRRSSVESVSGRKKAKADSSKKRTLASVHKTPESRKKKSRDFHTPGTTPGAMSVVSTPGTGEFPRAYALPDDTFLGESGDETDEDDGDTSFQPDSSSFLQSAKKRAALIPDDFDDDEEGLGLRRSRRATKGQTFKWWKGSERRVYQNGELRGVMEGAATPAPKHKKHAAKKNGAVKYEVAAVPLDPGFLPEEYVYAEVDELRVWDDVACKPMKSKVLCYEDTLVPADLPVTARRKPGKGGVSRAAQSFNVEPVPNQQSGWISGFALLPPQAIKDAEGVGACAQVFFVSNAQPKSLELAIASPDSEEFDDQTAQRVLLSAGDHFHVPPGNLYRLENHSRTIEAKVFWIIIKPHSEIDETS